MQRETPLRKKLNDAAGWVIAACGLVAVIVITAITSSPGNALGAGLLFLGLLAGSFLAVAVHELGHALGARLVGWRVWIISVAGIVVRLGHAPRFSTKYTRDVGGYVLGSPPEGALDVPWRSITFSAGGPLASLLTGPLFIYWLSTLPRGDWETPLGAGMLGAILAFGAASTSAAMATLWPMRSRGGRPNDMGMILDELFSRRPRTETQGVAWAAALFGHGVEPRAWPRWMHESIARAATNPWAPPTAAFMAFVAALETNDEPAVRRTAQRDAHEPGQLMRAFVSAYFDNDAQSAEKHRHGVAIHPSDEALVLLDHFISARIATLNGDTQTAARHYAAIAEDLTIDAPKPFWEQLLTRYRQ
jgi:hypothetical protein